MTAEKAEETIGTKELAAKLKIDPKTLRKHLRAINGEASGKRYEWKPNDPFLKKLPELIKGAEAKESAAKKTKFAKK
jgi:hypothetical protein